MLGVYREISDTNPAALGVLSTVHAVVVGQVVAVLRKRHGIGQQDFAEKVGVSQATLSRIERGQATPDHFVFGRVADQFGMAASELSATVEKATENTRRVAAGATRQNVDSADMWVNVLKVDGVVGLLGLAAFSVAVVMHENDEAGVNPRTSTERAAPMILGT